jgi:hypothetical protein
MSRASSKEEMPFLQLAKPHRREPLALLLRFQQSRIFGKLIAMSASPQKSMCG